MQTALRGSLCLPCTCTWKPVTYLLSLGQVSWAKGAAIFLVGLLFGWLIIGWVLWPVEYYDTDPPDLRGSHQEAYMSLVADSFGLNGDVQLARERLQDFNDCLGYFRKQCSNLLALAQHRGAEIRSGDALKSVACILNMFGDAVLVERERADVDQEAADNEEQNQEDEQED